MVFSSLTFLCLFLPLAVVPYFLWKNRVYRNALPRWHRRKASPMP